MRINKALILLVFLVQITAVFAMPVIESFQVQFAYPNQVQLVWRISDSTGLSRIELYKEAKLIYKQDISGTKEANTYQVPDDGQKHFFEIKVYNEDGEVASELKQGGGDKTPPNITGPNKVFSNVKELNFKTTEPATCKAGLSQTSLINVSTDFQENHVAKLSFSEGSNKVYVKCADEAHNEMPKFGIIELVIDSIKPGKPGNFTSVVNNGNIKLGWSAVSDASGIDHYTISNSLKQLATVNTNSWDVTTNDSIYFVSAVDKAGNEGEKAEYGLKRDLLLKSDLKSATEDKEVKSENTTADDGKGISTTSIIAWTAFAVLVLVLVVWKISEHKSDKHGLNRYLSHRRKRGL